MVTSQPPQTIDDYAGFAAVLRTPSGRGIRLASARGLYRIFNAAQYRFYWSDSAPPVAGGGPQETDTTLAHTSTATFADGTWYLSVSSFDGVLDSGFLPIGPNGQTYLTMILSGGVLQPTPPSPPANAVLNVMAGGVIQIVAHYSNVPDGTNAAANWAIAYTTDGSTPASSSPSLTPAMAAGSTLQILQYSLPAQTGGTVVKVQLQTARALGGGAFAYSTPGAVLAATAITAGPTASLGIQSWPGQPPQGT